MFGSSGSRPGFFRVGITAAILKPEGTTPESSEQLMMVAIEGQMTGRQVFTKVVGIGPSLLEEVLALDTKSCTWSVSRVVRRNSTAVGRQ